MPPTWSSASSTITGQAPLGQQVAGGQAGGAAAEDHGRLVAHRGARASPAGSTLSSARLASVLLGSFVLVLAHPGLLVEDGAHADAAASPVEGQHGRPARSAGCAPGPAPLGRARPHELGPGRAPLVPSPMTGRTRSTRRRAGASQHRLQACAGVARSRRGRASRQSMTRGSRPARAGRRVERRRRRQVVAQHGVCSGWVEITRSPGLQLPARAAHRALDLFLSSKGCWIAQTEDDHEGERGPTLPARARPRPEQEQRTEQAPR